MNKLNILLILVWIFVISCDYNTDYTNRNKNQKRQFEGFTLICPQNIKINKKTPVEDFDIYEFVYDGNIILSAYVGNQPHFYDNVQETTKIEKGFINGLNFESFVSEKSDGPEKKEILIKFSERRDWPNYIHFWYSNLTPEIRKIVEQIISSTEEI